MTVFVYAEDATLQGIYLKLRLLAETEVSADLDEGPAPPVGRASS